MKKGGMGNGSGGGSRGTGEWEVFSPDISL
jgi:hypothetical protein